MATKLLPGEKVNFKKDKKESGAWLHGPAQEEAAKKCKTEPAPAVGFNAPLTPDSVLADIIGAKPRARGEITKALWAVIKTPGNKEVKQDGCQIVATSPKWKAFLGADRLGQMKMATQVKLHTTK